MKRIIVPLLIAVFIFQQPIYVTALNTGFETSEMVLQDEKKYVEKLDFEKMFNFEARNSVCCFDISDEGLVALGFYAEPKDYIVVLSSDGDFLYGHSFKSLGNFGLEWSDKNCLMIYFVRSDIILPIDSEGICERLQKIETSYENELYWQKNVFSRSRDVNGEQYVLKNNMGPLNLLATKYSLVVKIDKNGKEKILYDVNEIALIRIFFIVLIVLLFVGIAVTVIIKSSKVKERQGTVPRLNI